MEYVQWTVADDERCAGWARMRATHAGEFRDISATGNHIDAFGIMTVQVDNAGHMTDFSLAMDRMTILTQIGANLTRPAPATI